ncbi:MAG TPA: biopolymer transporter ExbD [Gammaproteobacteria bacterium]|nr:biopolymer transporter ExbD [Gammaproteobacteria bacterium]
MAFRYNDSPVSSGQPMAEINMIPLVDIMLVLLVIFIITAPLFHQALPIDLPRVEASPVEEEPRTLQVALDAKGTLFVEGERLARVEFDARLATLAQTAGPAPELHLHADRATRYERVAEVMAAAQQAGIHRIAFMTDPNANRVP